MSPDTKMMSEMNPMADRTQKQTVIKQTMPRPMGMPKPQERKSKNVEVAAGMPKMAMGGKNKAFAALAPPRDKITYADKIAGATKRSG